jgi:hypothetical protein
MSDLEHLKSKRYWALILLGPPLQFIFAYVVFAGLHLGLGLPQPTLADAGLIVSLLEMFGFLIVLGFASRLGIRMAYGPKCPAQDQLRRRADDGLIGMFPAVMAMVAGYAAVLMVARYFGMQPAVDLDNSFILLLVVILSTIHSAEEVWRGERRQPRHTDVTEGTGT